MLKAIVWATLFLVGAAAAGAHPALTVLGAVVTGVLTLAATDDKRKY